MHIGVLCNVCSFGFDLWIGRLKRFALVAEKWAYPRRRAWSLRRPCGCLGRGGQWCTEWGAWIGCEAALAAPTGAPRAATPPTAGAPESGGPRRSPPSATSSTLGPAEITNLQVRRGEIYNYNGVVTSDLIHRENGRRFLTPLVRAGCLLTGLEAACSGKSGGVRHRSALAKASSYPVSRQPAQTSGVRKRLPFSTGKVSPL